MATFTVSEAAESLCMSKEFLQHLIDNGHVETVVVDDEIAIPEQRVFVLALPGSGGVPQRSTQKLKNLPFDSVIPGTPIVSTVFAPSGRIRKSS